jgi:uncharacterized SAM-binding protein YcdF (DUF218 family)
MKRPKKYLLVILIAIVFLGTSIFISREQILLSFGDFLIIQDEIHPADLIHVIAGLDHRTDYAIHLYKLGYGKRIFFTGGWCRGHNYYHGEHSKKLALEHGIPLEAIVADDSHVTSTYSEIVRLKKFIEKSPKPIHSILLVSDPHHMRRARWTYHRVLNNKIQLEMAPVPFEFSAYKRRWWTDAGTRKMVKDEYIKSLYYHARYQLSCGPLRNWLASLDKD